MKLLIVDDEELTRGGLLRAIDWAGLGFTQVLAADDGVNGLQTAREERPDIVLCDVRMPRMNGIDMLREIRREAPDTVAVFMSGYSDKEYLKSAIQLQAVDYIEKPIDAREMTDTMRQAVERVRARKAREQIWIPADGQAEHMAYLMTMPFTSNREEILLLAQQMNLSAETHAFSIIVKLRRFSQERYGLEELCGTFRTYLQQMHLRVIHTEKKLVHTVFFVLGERPMQSSTLQMVTEKLRELFHGRDEFYIVCGTQEDRLADAYRSYENAVVLLQESFLHEPGSVLTKSSSELSVPIPSDDIHRWVATYETSLNDGNRQDAETILAKSYERLGSSYGLMPNQIKNIYYDLFLTLYKVRRNRQLVPDESIEEQENIMDIMENCFSYRELHEILTDKTTRFFDDMDEHVVENPIVSMIRNYIGESYGDPSLSVKSISEHVNLSASYLCTFFKHETGETLNQYITDYRIRKAKLLLADPRNRIAEISSNVGYNDGNYFAKTFRKMTGLSPSEYREQVLGSEQK